MPFSLTIHLACDSFSFMLFGLAGSTYLRSLLLHAHTHLFSVAVRVVRLLPADSTYLEKGRTTFWTRDQQYLGLKYYYNTLPNSFGVVANIIVPKHSRCHYNDDDC